MSDLIDTTEMYLKTIYELEEEGIVPLRARIAERLTSPARPSARQSPAWSVTGCSRSKVTATSSCPRWATRWPCESCASIDSLSGC